jgi:hypothetical protein
VDHRRGRVGLTLVPTGSAARDEAHLLAAMAKTIRMRQVKAPKDPAYPTTRLTLEAASGLFTPADRDERLAERIQEILTSSHGAMTIGNVAAALYPTCPDAKEIERVRRALSRLAKSRTRPGHPGTPGPVRAEPS